MAMDNAYLVYRSLRTVHQTMKMGIGHHQQAMVVVRRHSVGLKVSSGSRTEVPSAVLTGSCEFDAFQ
jgi:hypothetical protein